MIEDPKLLSLLVSLIATLAHLIVSGIVLRISKQRFLLWIMGGFFLMLTICISLFMNHRISQVHFVIFFFTGFVLNLFVYGAVAKSLSLEMLSKLYTSSARQMHHNAVDKEVTMNSFIRRINLLVDNGWVSKKNGAYAVSQEGNRKAETILLVRRFLRIRNSGLYDG